MSREVRRVPLDFDWPMNKVWEGYTTSDRLLEDRCPDCRRGMTWAREWISTLANRIDMLASDIGDQERGRPMHPWLANDEYPAHTDFAYDAQGRTVETPKVMRPTKDILELVSGLTGQSPERLTSALRGNDYGIESKIIEAAGLDSRKWGVCPTCDGHGSVEKYPGQRAESEAWEPSEPPKGDGWQLWETVSEGSPVSPVFTTADELTAWMSDPDRGDRWVPHATAASFIADGWAPSFVSTPATGVVSGVEWVGHHADEQ
jgi:hypothetical protein